MEETVTIDADLLPKLREQADAEHVSLTQLANQLIRSCVVDPSKVERVFKVNDRYYTLDQAAALADALYDEEFIKKMQIHQ